MMQSLEVSAKTVEEAIQLALEQLGIGREEVKVIVLKEGRSGILGLGTEEVRIRVEPLVEVAKDALEVLLTKMGVTASVVPHTQPFVEEEESVVPIALDIEGDDLGILIGRRGQTLSCLQYILRLIVSNQMKDWVSITLDVEGYRQRRYEVLRALAERMAERVKDMGVPFTLEPMFAYERRIVHLALAEHPDVITQSVGEGEARKVVILPKETAESD